MRGALLDCIQLGEKPQQPPILHLLGQFRRARATPAALVLGFLLMLGPVAVMVAGARDACAFATLAFADNEGRAALREARCNRALTAAIDRNPNDQRVQEMARALIAEIK